MQEINLTDVDGLDNYVNNNIISEWVLDKDYTEDFREYMLKNKIFTNEEIYMWSI